MSKTSTWAMTAAAVMLSSTLTTVSQQGSAATLYRWTDANGSPVISDRPPPTGTPYTTLDSRGYAPKPSSTPTPMAAPRDESNKEQPTNAGMLLGDGEAPVRREQPAPASAEECAQIKDDIFKLETFARVRAVDAESGEVLYMTESERETRLTDARTFLDQRC